MKTFRILISLSLLAGIAALFFRVEHKLNQMQEQQNRDSRALSQLLMGEMFRNTPYPPGLNPQERVDHFISRNQPLDEGMMEVLRLREYWLKIAKAEYSAHH